MKVYVEKNNIYIFFKELKMTLIYIYIYIYIYIIFKWFLSFF
ncbi:MAG: hypothetical protein N7Q72_04660 [Spiroplasma sp. Tabriz.8]|nr:hypothetical protein [Spiroplasma sp. Tabriz.8]